MNRCFQVPKIIVALFAFKKTCWTELGTFLKLPLFSVCLFFACLLATLKRLPARQYNNDNIPTC